METQTHSSLQDLRQAGTFVEMETLCCWQIEKKKATRRNLFMLLATISGSWMANNAQ